MCGWPPTSLWQPFPPRSGHRRRRRPLRSLWRERKHSSQCAGKYKRRRRRLSLRHQQRHRPPQCLRCGPTHRLLLRPRWRRLRRPTQGLARLQAKRRPPRRQRYPTACRRFKCRAHCWDANRPIEQSRKTTMTAHTLKHLAPLARPLALLAAPMLGRRVGGLRGVQHAGVGSEIWRQRARHSQPPSHRRTARPTARPGGRARRRGSSTHPGALPGLLQRARQEL